MTKLISGIFAVLMLAAAPSFASCVKDTAGLPVDKISKSAAMDVLNQIGGFSGLSGKWTTDGGSFDFAVVDGKVAVTYTIGKTSRATTVTEVCKTGASTLKVVATAGGKTYTVYLALTGNPGKIQLGFDPDDLTDFVKK